MSLGSKAYEPVSYDLTHVEEELDNFSKLIKKALLLFGGSNAGEDIYILGDAAAYSPPAGESLNAKSHKNSGPSNTSASEGPTWRHKKYPLAVSALIHGNEVGGLASINAFLSDIILSGTLPIEPLIVFLGNTAAAREGVRYIDGDLNRCFDDTTKVPSDHHERNRAEVLKEPLSQVAFYFDLHQTSLFTPHGFYIFAYHPERWHLARTVLPRLPIVTYWDHVFSREGMCGDQYVNSLGGVAITLEIGQNGFDPWHVALGTHGLHGACHYAYLRTHQRTPRKDLHLYSSACVGLTYTWADVINYPSEGEVRPTMNFGNFTPIESGEILAQVNGQPLILPTSGYSFFPTLEYSSADRPSPQGSGKDQRPYELLRVLKKITPEDLPFISESPSAFF